VVPERVSSVHPVAQGAPGGVGLGGDPAGSGAQVSGDLAVTQGQTLYVEVGGAPTNTSNCFPDVACVGGFNGGGSSSLIGGGGGGASDVRTEPRSTSLSIDDSGLIVAGGGGGSGASGRCEDALPDLLPGGAGDDAGMDGANGASCGSADGGNGG
jgi:hypothetical protein